MIEFCKEEFFKYYGPREKLKYTPINKLNEYELWALAIGSGSKNRNIIEISKDIVKVLNNLVVKEEYENIEYKLKQIEGVGEITAIKIKAILELNKKFNKIKFEKTITNNNNKERLKYKFEKNKSKKINSSKDVFNEIVKQINFENQETFNVMYLNSKLEIIKTEMIFKGTLNFVNVHPREIFKKAVLYSAHSIILSHNHPSEHIDPSTEDKEVTKRLIKLGIEMGIRIIDHIIISNNEYRSMLEYGDVEF